MTDVGRAPRAGCIPHMAALGRGGAATSTTEDTMTNCRAALTVCTTTDDVVAYSHTGSELWHWERDAVSDGVAVVRDGDRLLRLDVVTIKCAHPGPSCISDGTKVGVHESANGEVWSDDTPGAASHADNTPPADTHDVYPYGQQRLDGFACRDCNWQAGPDKSSKAEEHAKTPVTPPADVCPRCKGGKDALVHGHCPSCGGTGVDEDSWVPSTPLTPDEVDQCPSCGGAGWVNCECQIDHQSHDCPSCGGTGEVKAGWSQKAPCPSCAELKPVDRPLYHLTKHGGTGDRPAVTDEQDAAAINAYLNVTGQMPSIRGMRAALEAAAATRQEKR